MGDSCIFLNSINEIPSEVGTYISNKTLIIGHQISSTYRKTGEKKGD